MPAAAATLPAIRPGFRLRIVWLRNIRSWARQRSTPMRSPSSNRAPALILEASQHGADVFFVASGELEEDLLQRLAVLADHMPQFLQAAGRDQPPVVDDGHPGAHPLGDLQDVGREEHGFPLAAEILEDVLHLPSALGIQPDSGFVEEE